MGGVPQAESTRKETLAGGNVAAGSEFLASSASPLCLLPVFITDFCFYLVPRLVLLEPVGGRLTPSASRVPRTAFSHFLGATHANSRPFLLSRLPPFLFIPFRRAAAGWTGRVATGGQEEMPLESCGGAAGRSVASLAFRLSVVALGSLASAPTCCW